MSDTAPATADVPGRRRHRGRNALIALAIVVVVLVVAAVVLDGVARSYASGLIRDKVRSSLSLPASTPIDVTIQGASVLLQLASGTLQQVDIAAPNLTVGQLTGDAKLTVRGVPISAGRPIDGATLKFSTGEAGLHKLLSGFSGVPINSVAISSGVLRVGGSVTVFAAPLPIQVGFVPSAVDGELALTPKYVVVNGAKITPAALKNTFGSLADAVTQTQKICVANLLPKAFHLDSVAVSGPNLVLAVSTGAVLLEQSTFTTQGTCPG